MFTQPAHRGRGAARELIERLLDKVVAEGADAALLFSEIGADYYARLGFAAIPLDDSVAARDRGSTRGAPVTMVRAGDDRDLDASSPWTRPARSRSVSTSIAIAISSNSRSRSDAARGPSVPGARSVQFFVAEEGASAVAYVVICVNGGAWTIDSCGDRDPAGARLGAHPAGPGRARARRASPDDRRRGCRHHCGPPQVAIVGATPSTDLMMFKPLSAAAAGVDDALRLSDVLFWRGDAF